MKKLLFIMNDLECGGAQKSLLSILETIDYSKYEVDLFLFKHKGDFLKNIPNKVRVLPEPINYKYFEGPIIKSVKEIIKKGKIVSAIKRIQIGKIYKTEKRSSVVEQKVWKYIKDILGSNNKYYDSAIAFMERGPIYYAVDNVQAKIKIGWIHTDYTKLNADKEFDKAYFNKLDFLVTISDDCAKVLSDQFNDMKDKIKVINNIVSSSIINKLAYEEVIFPYDKEDRVKLISVGRVEPEKGFDIAIEACKILCDKGINVSWYIVGDGTQRKSLEKKAKEYHISDRFCILGVKNNPYAYIEKSAIYVQPSRYEGKSIAIDEAKIIAKPIIVTNFNTAKYQIDNRKNGLIVDTSAIALAEGIEELINDNNLRTKLIKELKRYNFGNESEISKLYKLIN